MTLAILATTQIVNSEVVLEGNNLNQEELNEGLINAVRGAMTLRPVKSYFTVGTHMIPLYEKREKGGEDAYSVDD